MADGLARGRRARVVIGVVALRSGVVELRRVKRLLASEPDLRQLAATLDEVVRERSAPRHPLAPEHVAWGVRWAVRLLGPRHDDCVPRSLATYLLLLRHGYDARFVSGVRREGDALVGHAWVTVAGTPLGARDARAPSDHTVLFTIGPGGPEGR